MRSFASPSGFSRSIALGLAVALAMTHTSPVRGDTPTDPPDPLQVLIEGDPHDFLTRDAAGAIQPITDGLDPYAAMILTEAARTLNESSAAGYLSVSADFSVKVTKAGRAYARQVIEEPSGGCNRVKSVTADWLGFHVNVTSECTAEEIAALTGVAADGEVASTVPTGQIMGTSGDSTNCVWSVVNFTANLVGLLLLVAMPPAGALWWLAVVASGTGTIIGSVQTSHACAGLYDVDKRFKVGRSTYRAGCVFQWSAQWMYDTHGHWVPAYERWAC